MNVKQRALAGGGLAGLVGAGSALAGSALLGPQLGGAAGAIAAVACGAAGAALAAGAVARAVGQHLTALEGIGAMASAPPPLGWSAIDEALADAHRSLALAARARKELEGLERLARGLRGPADERNGPDSRVALPASRTAPGSSLRNGLAFRGNGLVEEIRESIGQIAREAEALGATTEKMASGAVDQTETVGRTTSTVEALSDRIDRISQSAEEAAAATERARQEARRGLGQIQGIIEGMDRLRSRVEANARKARRLGDRSMEINAIVELIGGLSSRTDMLALNASIESVLRGEHGRGFAVVAEEIRKLAERAAAATREIGTLVEAIQADAHESIRALGEEQAEMEQESRAVKEAGAALERISQVAEHSARIVENISLSANDQVLAAQDLVHAMQRISEVSRLILKETSQVRKEVQALAQRSRHLTGPPTDGGEIGADGPLSGLAVALPLHRFPSLEATS